MPSKTLWICAGVALVALALVFGGGVFVNRDQRVRLKGEVQKVRTGKLDEQRSVVVLDFRVTNPSQYPFQVKDLELEVTTGGRRWRGGSFRRRTRRTCFWGSGVRGEV